MEHTPSRKLSSLTHIPNKAPTPKEEKQSNTSPPSSSGIFLFVGPVLLVLSTIFEWIMGNFFPMMVMGLFSVFWLSFGLLQLPTLGLAAAYSTTGTNAAEGAASVAYNAAIALYLIVWGFALFTFFIFTLKTNTVFAMIFGLVSIAAWVLAGAYWKVSTGDYVMAGHLQTVCYFPLSFLISLADLAKVWGPC